MPGSVFDLSVHGTSVPDPIVVDTNVIAEYLLSSYFIPSLATQRAKQFFQELIVGNGTGIVTPTIFTEFIHVAVKVEYRRQFSQMTAVERNARYGRPVRNWKDLYKQDAAILQAFLPDLTTLRQLLIANGLVFVAPEEFGRIASGRGHDEELVDLVGTLGLDLSDAAILLEARRYGLADIVTLDADMRRAQTEFNIYTWT